MIIDHVQKRWQDPTMNFKEAATDLESLELELVNIHDYFRQRLTNAAQYLD